MKEPGMAAKSGGHRHHANYFNQTDLSIYMLGLPKSRSRLRNWIVLAVLMGTVLALAMLALGDLIF
jgi:hypothetical protein